MKQTDGQAEDYLARGFRDVDAAAVDKMARCLAYLDELPGFQQYKTQILDMMKPERGSITADLGCGLGFDVRRLSAFVGPEGRAIGVDLSLALIKSARSPSKEFPAIEFVQADIQKLPFANGSLGSCKIDRTLQHVENPTAALNEMFRTVRSGGTVVCAEPDWGTFAIDDAKHTIVKQIARFWSEGFRNPRIGRDLRKLLEKAGFVDLHAQEAVLATLNFESSDIVFDIKRSASQLAASSGNMEPLEWVAQLRERDRVDPVSCSVILLINFAKRP